MIGLTGVWSRVKVSELRSSDTIELASNRARGTKEVDRPKQCGFFVDKLDVQDS